MADIPEKILVRVYVDALNFYYGIARKYQFKWIDMRGLFLELIQKKIPNAEIEKIYLYTTMVRGDDAARARQNRYLAALREEYGNGMEILEGRMMEVQKVGKPLNNGIEMIAENKRGLVAIRTYEEKKTDVNLACQMVKDAYTAVDGRFHVACLVSNDSDLESPLIMKKDLKQRTLLICPRTTRSKVGPSKNLKNNVDQKDVIHYISRNILKKHRLPNPVKKWHCPDVWVEEERIEEERLEKERTQSQT